VRLALVAQELVPTQMETMAQVAGLVHLELLNMPMVAELDWEALQVPLRLVLAAVVHPLRGIIPQMVGCQEQIILDQQLHKQLLTIVALAADQAALTLQALRNGVAAAERLEKPLMELLVVTHYGVVGEVVLVAAAMILMLQRLLVVLAAAFLGIVKTATAH
jgi:hypothetical protein